MSTSTHGKKNKCYVLKSLISSFVLVYCVYLRLHVWVSVLNKSDHLSVNFLLAIRHIFYIFTCNRTQNFIFTCRCFFSFMKGWLVLKCYLHAFEHYKNCALFDEDTNSGPKNILDKFMGSFIEYFISSHLRSFFNTWQIKLFYLLYL